MGVTNFPNGIASFGVPVLPFVGPNVSVAPVFFVCNATNANGSNGNNGKDAEHPLSTVDYAIGLCSAVLGGTIYVLPGHAETVTATLITHDVANVSVIGLGQGASRPTFTYGAAAATITVSAKGARWSNCHFVANFLDVAAAFTLAAAKDCVLDGNTFLDTSAVLNFLSVVVTNATANAADGLAVIGNHVISKPTTDGAVVSVLEAIARLRIENNIVDKLATVDAGHLVTLAAFAAVGTRVLNNVLTMNALASQSAGTLGTGSSTASSGIVAGNLVYQIDTSTALLWTAGSKLGFLENYVSGAADKSGTLFPSADDPA